MQVNNYAGQNRFKFQLTDKITKELDDIMQYNVTGVTLPGVTIGVTNYATPIKDASIPGDVVEFEDLTLTFLVDKSLKSWFSIFEWMQKCKRFHEAGGAAFYKDANLLIHDNDFVPIIGFRFEDIFPFSLTGLEYSSTIDMNEPLQATATFRVNGFKYELL